jgi:hypothetical protein
MYSILRHRTVPEGAFVRYLVQQHINVVQAVLLELVGVAHHLRRAEVRSLETHTVGLEPCNFLPELSSHTGTTPSLIPQDTGNNNVHTCYYTRKSSPLVAKDPHTL